VLNGEIHNIGIGDGSHVVVSMIGSSSYSYVGGITGSGGTISNCFYDSSP